MKRIKLTVAYDGTRYCGWQIQPKDITVEGILNQTLSKLLQEDITVIGASRTDAGVHAMGNVAVFDTDSTIPANKMAYAVNQWLPEDIKIQHSEEVAADFHPRKTMCIKTYQYRISNCDFLNPLTRNYAYFVYKPLNMEKMKVAAEMLIGTHDFKSFCSTNTTVEDTVRTIYQISLSKSEDEIQITIQGNGFLYNMVRIIAGTLVQIGLGQSKYEDIETILLAKDRTLAGPTAPAHGLMLKSIEYLNERANK